MAHHALHRHARIAPRKAALVMELIRGRAVDDAFAQLEFSKKRAAVMVRKVLASAVANYHDQETAPNTRDPLVITEARVGPGPTIKRFQPKDRGKAHSILKRTSHLFVAVEPRPALADDDDAQTADTAAAAA